jgi:hypothetical protein
MEFDGALLVKFASGEWKASKKQVIDMANELIKLRNLVDSIRYGIDKAMGYSQPDVLDLSHERYLRKV